MKLGVGSYTYVWAVGVPGYPAPARPMTAFDLLERAAGLGVGVLQIADNLPLDRLPVWGRATLARAAEGMGIEIEVGMRGIDPACIREYVGIAEQLGSSFVRTLTDTPTHRPTQAEATSLLRAVAPDLASAGVRLGIENHDRFPAETLVDIVRGAGSDAIGICLDTANSIGCLEGTATVLETLGPHTLNLHVKDCRVSRLPHEKGFVVEGCPAGQGQVDVPAVVRRIAGFGHDPNVILELWPPPDADIEKAVAREREWAEESVRYLRSVLERTPEASRT
jgi:sugar phosphate isomerase/epimerase